MKTEFTSSRRTFLKGAAFLAGFAACFGRERSAAAKHEPADAAKEEPAGTYRLTEHVKKYYETAGY